MQDMNHNSKTDTCKLITQFKNCYITNTASSTRCSSVSHFSESWSGVTVSKFRVINLPCKDILLSYSKVSLKYAAYFAFFYLCSFC